MNFLKIVAVIKLLVENKDQILELIKLIQTLLASPNLIGDADGATVYHDSASYPQVAQAVAAAGLDWSGFIKVLIENLDSLKELVAAIVQIIDLFSTDKK